MGNTVLFLIDDLHLEGRPEEMQKGFAEKLMSQINKSKSEGDSPILVCAGDISEKDAGMDWVKQFDVETIYICGNHEFWQNDYYEVIDLLKAKSQMPGYEKIHFLHNDEVIINGIRFLGSTMWTELGQSWAWVKRNYILKHFFSMADFKRITAHKFYRNKEKVDEMFKLLIKNGVEPDQATTVISSELFNPLIQIEENEASVDFLENKMIEPFDGKTVVVTHHLPIPKFWMDKLEMNENIMTSSYINNKSVYQEYLKQKVPAEKDILMMGFYVNTSYQFFEHNFSPDIWIHGHFHKPVDDYIGTTRIVSNPVGYLRQSENLEIKKIVIGNEIDNYIENSIRTINSYEWENKINSNLIDFKRVIKDFSLPITEEKLDPESFLPILNSFIKVHEQNLKDVEVFVSNLLYNLIKISHKDISISDQLYITSFISGFGKWTVKNGRESIDLLSLLLNDNSFLSENAYKKIKDKMDLEHYLDWIREINKVEKQVINFKKALIDYFNYIKQPGVLDSVINTDNI